MKTLQELNVDIHKLQQQREVVQKKLMKENEEEIRSLKWLKDTKVYFKTNHYGAYGNEEYILWGSRPKHLKGSIVLKGNSPHYQYNLMLNSGWGMLDIDIFEIITSNHKLFIEFIENNRIKIEKNDHILQEFNVLVTVVEHMKGLITPVDDKTNNVEIK